MASFVTERDALRNALDALRDRQDPEDHRYWKFASLMTIRVERTAIPAVMAVLSRREGHFDKDIEAYEHFKVKPRTFKVWKKRIEKLVEKIKDEGSEPDEGSKLSEVEYERFANALLADSPTSEASQEVPSSQEAHPASPIAQLGTAVGCPSTPWRTPVMANLAGSHSQQHDFSSGEQYRSLSATQSYPFSGADFSPGAQYRSLSATQPYPFSEANDKFDNTNTQAAKGTQTNSPTTGSSGGEVVCLDSLVEAAGKLSICASVVVKAEKALSATAPLPP